MKKIKNESIHCCQQMTRILNEKKAYIEYCPQFREYYINLRKEKMIAYRISYCPWCGTTLPKDLRDEWFHTLETEYNIDYPRDEEQEKRIPEEFKSDKWWKKRGL